MPQIDWQNVAAISVVGATALYLGYRAWIRLSSRKQTGCGSCGDCPASTASTGQSAGRIVAVDSLVESARRQR